MRTETTSNQCGLDPSNRGSCDALNGLGKGKAAAFDDVAERPNGHSANGGHKLDVVAHAIADDSSDSSDESSDADDAGCAPNGSHAASPPAEAAARDVAPDAAAAAPTAPSPPQEADGNAAEQPATTSEQQAATSEQQATTSEQQAATDPAAPAAAQGSSAPSANGSSDDASTKLSAAAKEFVPSFAAQPQQPEAAANGATDGAQLVAYYDEAGQYLYTAPYTSYGGGPGGPAQYGAGYYGADGAYYSYESYGAEYWAGQGGAWGGGAYAPGVDQSYADAALAMLCDQFPGYSYEQLFATFMEQGCDVLSTSDLLCTLEAEQAGQQAGQGARKAGKKSKGKRSQELNLTSEKDFPALAPPSPPASAAATADSGSDKDAPAAQPPLSDEGSEHGPLTAGPAEEAAAGVTVEAEEGDGAVATPGDGGSDNGAAQQQEEEVQGGEQEQQDGEGQRQAQEQPAPKAPAAATAAPKAWGRANGGSFLEAVKRAAAVEVEAAAANPGKPASQSPPPPAWGAAAPAAPKTPTKVSGGSPVAAPRVETGAQVSAQYSAARSAARDHARVRNMYFMQATQAYLAGNRKLAKELGAKGRAANEAMKSAHAQASSTIYRARNSAAAAQQQRVGGGSGGAAASFIDLHGLHVSEALQLLGRELSALQQQQRGAAGGKAGGRGGRKVQICVGTGSHTKGPRTPARLPPAVEQFLADKGMRYTYVMPGLIQLQLSA